MLAYSMMQFSAYLIIFYEPEANSKEKRHETFVLILISELGDW